MTADLAANSHKPVRAAARRWRKMRRTLRVFIHMSIMGMTCLAALTAQAGEARRIVSLAPHLTELAFSAGAGDRVVATVEYSDYPSRARRIPRIGDAFRVDLERLLALQPDAVLAWQSGTPAALIERIRALHLRVVTLETHRIADVGTAVREIGRLAGTGEVAQQAAMQFEEEIRQLRQRYQGRRRLRVFLQVDDQPLYTVNGRQIMSEVVEVCGGDNVFADLGDLAPVIDIEAVVAADPEVILSTDDTVQDPGSLWRRWPQLVAVRSGNIYGVNSGNVARATTRLVSGTREVCAVLDKARERLAEEGGH